MNTRDILALSLTFLLMAGCGAEQSEPQHAETDLETKTISITPERIEIDLPVTADYASDFALSMDSGDFRFVGIMGYAMAVPGVPDYYERYSESNGVKVIKGTSDSYDAADTAAFGAQVFYEEYAKSYNALLLDYLKSRAESGQTTPQTTAETETTKAQPASTTTGYGQSALWITIDDLVTNELMLTDSEGRRTGFDPITGDSCLEIPNAVYYDEYIESPDGDGGMGSKQIQVSPPTSDEYELRVMAMADGTYELGVYGQDADGEPFAGDFKNVPVTTNAAHVYTIVFDRTSGAAGAVIGGFGGSDNESKDIDRLLSYANVSQTNTRLAEGAKNYGLYAIYGGRVLAESFAASINGQDISESFVPRANGYETVSVTLRAGYNVLVLTIDGETPDGPARDTDSLIFVVE